MFLRDFAFRLVKAGTPRGELIVETRRRAAAPRDALWIEVAAPLAPRSVPRAAAPRALLWIEVAAASSSPASARR